MDEDCNSSAQPVKEMEKDLKNDDTLEDLTAAGFRMIAGAAKKSNDLPSGKARDLYESYPSFHKVMKTQANHVLTMLSTMIKYTNSRECMQKIDDDDKFEMVVDANDNLLENVGIALDELSGIRKNPESKFIAKRSVFVEGSWNRRKANEMASVAGTRILNAILNQTRHMEKPQLKFEDKINNDPDVPFEPRIKEKYNVLKPLSLILRTDEDGICHFSHPYEFELEKFSPGADLLLRRPPTLYKPLAETPLIFVNKVEDVVEMVNHLEKCKEVAVDVEHHSYRSFQGFTCLVQISTRDTDYLIDALALRSELHILNRVFTNPSIVKVFHGADLDVLWLQRDLSVYIVNMFDTHRAAKILSFPKLSLRYLLSHYCNVDSQKHFQLADWRVRPLPQELVTYAREDTHYLLFIYDKLKNALIEKANDRTNLLEAVISESTRLCLKIYFKPRFEKDGYLDIYRRSKKLFDDRQKFALQRLFEWRDAIARKSDESYAYVLPDHMMLNISEILPREAQGILACCNPVPAPVRQNLLALHQIIIKARERPPVRPILEEEKFYRHASSSNPSNDPLRCPHDSNHEGELGDDLPVLCGASDTLTLGNSKMGENNVPCSNDRPTPIVDVFESQNDSSKAAERRLIARMTVCSTPYHLYRLSKRFAESLEPTENFNKSEHRPEQVQENVRLSVPDEKKKETNDQPDEPENAEKDDKEGNGRCETDIGEKRMDVIDERETAIADEKKMEGNAQKKRSKKRKRKESRVGAANPDESTEGSKGGTESCATKKKRKNKIQGKKKKFQPFDYNSVDFGKFKSWPVSSKDTARKVNKVTERRRKKSGKKNLRISV